MEILFSLAWQILGGGLVFGVYYLLYRHALKKKGSITNASFVVKAPLFIGLANLVALVCLFFRLVPLESSTLLYNIFSIYYFFSIDALSIGSIAITFLEYKRKLISSKRFGIVLLINIICIILVLMLHYWFWEIFAHTCSVDFCWGEGG